MNTIYHGGVCIKYTNNEINDKNFLINALINDPYVMRGIVPKNITLHRPNTPNNIIGTEDGVVYIDDVYSFVKENVTPTFDRVKAKMNSIGKDELLIRAYAKLISYKDTDAKNLRDSIDEDSLYSLVAMVYSKDVDTYLRLVSKRHVSLRDDLFLIVSSDYRDKTLNHYLRLLNNDISKYGRNYVDVLKFISRTSKYDHKDNDFDKSKLTYINIDTLKYLTKRALITIDPTCLWLRQYEKGISNGSIIYIDSEEDKKKYDVHKSCCKDGIMYVLRNNDLNDFVVSIHEFAHYISSLCGDSSNIKLSEYPPILFENFAFDFLIKRGYSEDEVNYLKNRRNNTFSKNYNSFIPIFRLMCLQEKSPNKEITNFKSILSSEGEDTDSIINKYIINISNNRCHIIKDSLYLVGDFFRTLYLRINGTNLEDMVNTTERLNDTSISQLVLKLKQDKNNK